MSRSVIFFNYTIRWQIRKSTNVIFYICDFHQGVTYVNDFNRQPHIHTNTHTHTHTHTETDKPISVSEILHICLKINFVNKNWVKFTI